MLYKNINDFKVSVIGLGTHLIGGKAEPDYSKDNDYINLIKKAVDLGVNHIDTAEIYANGHSEEIIGSSIENLDRKKLFIASKVWPANFKDLKNSLNNSLKRLKTDYLDLYYLHYPNPEVSLKETMKTLEQAKNDGLINNIGLSNFSLDLLKEAQSYLKDSRISAIQMEYNLLNKSIKHDLLPFCKEQDITLVAYKPLAKGLLLKSEGILDELSQKYNKTKAQIALNWLVFQDNVITIPKVSSLEHLKENLESLNFSLDKDDFDRLNK